MKNIILTLSAFAISSPVLAGHHEAGEENESFESVDLSDDQSSYQ